MPDGSLGVLLLKVAMVAFVAYWITVAITRWQIRRRLPPPRTAPTPAVPTPGFIRPTPSAPPAVEPFDLTPYEAPTARSEPFDLSPYEVSAPTEPAFDFADEQEAENDEPFDLAAEDLSAATAPSDSGEPPFVEPGSPPTIEPAASAQDEPEPVFDLAAEDLSAAAPEHGPATASGSPGGSEPIFDLATEDLSAATGPTEPVESPVAEPGSPPTVEPASQAVDTESGFDDALPVGEQDPEPEPLAAEESADGGGGAFELERFERASVVPPGPLACSEGTLGEATGSFRPADAPWEPVDCTVFGPRAVVPEVEFAIEVYAHPPVVGDVAHGADALGTRALVGTMLRFELHLPDAEIDDAVRELQWQGRTERVRFGVRLADGAGPKLHTARLVAVQDTVPIGIVRWTLRATPRSDGGDAVALGTARRYATAFVAGSIRDREEILPRLELLSRVGVGYRLEDLQLGQEDGHAAELTARLGQCDVLYVFWSTAAQESEGVARQWRAALETMQADSIFLVPTGEPPFPPPPRDLLQVICREDTPYFLLPEEQVL